MTVVEWLDPYVAIKEFGDNIWVKRYNEADEQEREVNAQLIAAGQDDSPELNKAKALVSIYETYLVLTVTFQLRAGRLIAKGFRVPIVPPPRYIPISPSEWNILQLDPRKKEAAAEGVRYLGVSIGRAGAKPAFPAGARLMAKLKHGW